MDLRNNTVAGWVLGAGIVALGLTSLTGLFFRSERPEEGGYAIEGVASSTESAEVPVETLLASADLAAGEASFAKCATCHSINAGGANGIGPNLHGVVGTDIGSHAAGFSYSAALQGAEGNWTFANLNQWLTSPRRFANGTTMSFAGLSDPQERANLIAYLNSQGSNLPLPAAPAAPAEGAAPAAGEAAAAPPAEGAEAAAPAAPAAPAT
jgi:cytochrome c